MLLTSGQVISLSLMNFFAAFSLLAI